MFWKNQSTGIYDPVKKSFRKRSKYQLNGVSDIIGIYRGKPVFLEVKTDKGKMSQAQKDFLDRAKQCGAITGVVRSIDDALLALKQVDSDT